MRVLLTGTPGTGKTSIAREQERFKVLDLKKFAKDRGLGEPGEEEFLVDIERLREPVANETSERDWILEGHFAHRLEGDVCVVLRCDPEELEQRLSKRDYSDSKVRENLEAEAMDLVLQEAVNLHEKVIEIDTTGKKPGEVVSEMNRRIEKEEYGYGELDFSGWL